MRIGDDELRMIREARETINAVAEWYDAIGTDLNDFDGIQLICLKKGGVE